ADRAAPARFSSDIAFGFAAVECGLELEQVAPCLPLGFRLAEQIGRMKCRHQADGAIADGDLAPATAQPQDALGRIEHGLRGRTAEREDELGLDKLDLSLEEGAASLCFLRCRRAVSRWAPIDDVGD